MKSRAANRIVRLPITMVHPFSPKSGRRSLRGGLPLAGLILLLCLWGFAGGGVRSAAAGDWVTNPGQLKPPEVAFGLSGHVKLGTWAEISVTPPADVAGTITSVSVILPDTDGIPTRTHLRPDEGRFTGGVKLGRRDASIEIHFTTDSAASGRPSVWRVHVSEIANVLPSTTRWYLQLGPEVNAESIVRRASSPDTPAVYTRLDDLSELPHQWYLLEGIDHLIWTTSDARDMTGPSDPQLEALALWLKMGGRLTLSVGQAADRLIGPDQPLQRFAPGRFEQILSQRQTTELESYLGSPTRLDRPDTEPLQIALLRDLDGVVIIQEGSGDQRRPLWVRRVQGFGIVDFLTFDLDQEPMASWNGRDILLARLLAEGRLDTATRAAPAGRGVAHVGFDDLSGQLRRALDQYPGVTSISFFLIGLIIVVYLALIGPGDYFLLKKLAPAMEWTWVTFPLIVLLSAVGIWQLANWSKGRGTRVNQVDLIDVDLASGLVRGSSWAHLFSPDTTRYEIGIRPHRFPGGDWSSLLSWQGLPGGSMGGMNTRQTVGPIGTPYDIHWDQADGPPSTHLQNLPVQIWSTKSLYHRGWSQLADDQAFEPLTEGASQLISGTIANPTEHDLRDCYVFHGRWAYYIPRLAAGSQVNLPPGASAQHTEKLLKRGRGPDATEIAEQWDKQGTNVNRIMQVAMMHEAAGGKSYTDLTQRYQGFVDLTPLSATGRAILIGTSTERGTTLTLGGQPAAEEATNHWTFVRIVLPVRPPEN